jgi:uracil-DNA glycosylase family 4
MGIGPTDAKIMLIGENPGRTEDEEGVPFIGASGRLLDNMLIQLGIPRGSLYITNSVRCFTNLEDPKPTAKEIKLCRHFLEEEIRQVNPTVIGLLGATALKSILNRTGITKLKNNVLFSEEFNVKVIPMYHPAYVLRNAHEYNSLYEGLKLLQKESEFSHVDKTYENDCRYVVAKSEEEAVKILSLFDSKNHVVLDLETAGLNYLKDKIICVSLSCKNRFGAVIPWNFMKGSALEKFKDLLLSDKVKIGHNIKFDMQMLKTAGFHIKGPYFDTMLAHALIDENVKHGLDDLTLSYLDMGEYWAELEAEKISICKNKGIKKENLSYSLISDSVLFKYAAKDVDATHRLYEILSKELDRQNLTSFYNDHMIRFMPVILSMEYRGIKINREALYDLIVSYSGKLNKLEESMYAHPDVQSFENFRKSQFIRSLSLKYKQSKILMSRFPNGPEEYAEKIIKEKDWKFNFKSPVQLQDLFFKRMGLRPVKATKTGYSTDEEVLNTLAESGVDFAKHLIEYRGLAKYISTYLDSVYSKSEFDGRIHTSYLQHATVSGRLTSKSPNLQTIPRNANDFKKCFVSDPGYVFLKSDLAQAEFRCWAHYSNDQDMINDIHAGLDIHKVTASKVFNVPIEEIKKDDPRRTAAKACVIGETWIPTDSGFKQIRELGIGDKVLDHTNTKQTILEIIKKEDEVFFVDTDCGSITCTANHPFYTINKDGELVTKPLSELSSGDHILSCTPENMQDKYVEWEYCGDKNTSFKPIFDKWVLDEKLSFLVGFIVAEGSVYSRGTKYNVCWSQKGKYEEVINTLGTSIFSERVTAYIDKRTGVRTWKVNSLEFVEFLKYLGMCSNNKKGFKVFPKKVLESPKSVQKAFLQGYFMGDGTFKKDRACMGTVSKDLCDSLCLLLRIFGIYPKITIEHPKNGSEFYNIQITNVEELQILIQNLEICPPEHWDYPIQIRGRKFLHNVNSFYYKNHTNGDARYGIKIRKKLTHHFLNSCCRGLNASLDSLIDNKIYSVRVNSIKNIGKATVYDFITTGDKDMIANGFYTLDCVFGLMFGRGAKAISAEYGITEEQAEQVRENFFDMYPVASQWLRDTIRSAKETGVVKTWFGRIRRLPNLYSDNMGDRAEAERQATNSPIQGQASDMNNAYMVRICCKAKKAGIDCWPALTTHDDNTLQVREDQKEQLAEIMRDVVANAFPDFRCKMELELKWGYNLGEVENLK